MLSKHHHIGTHSHPATLGVTCVPCFLKQSECQQAGGNNSGQQGKCIAVQRGAARKELARNSVHLNYCAVYSIYHLLIMAMQQVGYKYSKFPHRPPIHSSKGKLADASEYGATTHHRKKEKRSRYSHHRTKVHKCSDELFPNKITPQHVPYEQQDAFRAPSTTFSHAILQYD